MSKERKVRRAERERQQQLALEKDARRQVRRAKWRRWQRTVTLHETRQRNTGRMLARRSRGQRAAIIVMAIVALFAIWNYVPSTALRVALTLLLVLALPVLVIVAFDKRST